MENMFVLACRDATQAFGLRDALLKCQDESLIRVAEAVVVTRDASGAVKAHQSADAVLGLASAGSVVGVIVGLLFAQPWIASAVGLGAGALLGALARLGISEQFAKQLGASLAPGTAALFLLGSGGQLDRLRERLGPLLEDCTILQTTVTQEREDEVLRLLGIARQPGPIGPTPPATADA
jgi:uncharacterized membrane protein